MSTVLSSPTHMSFMISSECTVVVIIVSVLAKAGKK